MLGAGCAQVPPQSATYAASGPGMAVVVAGGRGVTVAVLAAPAMLLRQFQQCLYKYGAPTMVGASNAFIMGLRVHFRRVQLVERT